MIEELTVEELIYRVADAGDSVDAGAAVAVVAMLGAGLMEMSLAITGRKLSDPSAQESIRKLIEGLQAVSARKAADHDWEVAEEYQAASQLPADTNDQERRRSDARLTAAMRRGRTQLMLRSAILETLAHADAALELTADSVLPDAGAGVHLLRAALLAAYCGQDAAWQQLECAIQEVAAQPERPRIDLDVSSLRQDMANDQVRDLERVDGALQRFTERLESPETTQVMGRRSTSASTPATREATPETAATSDRMWEWSLDELISRTESAAPTPSTGATVPVVAALGVSLLLRAIDLHTHVPPDSQGAFDSLEVEGSLRLLLSEFSDDADFDRDIVQRYLRALRGPCSTDEEREERRDRLREHLVRGTLGLHKQVLSILHVLSQIGNAVTIIDAGGRNEALAGVHFLEGAVAALRSCIEANVGDLERRLASEEGSVLPTLEWLPTFRDEVRQAGEEARTRSAIVRAALSAG